MAEMVLKQMLRERNIEGIDVDSCATSREEIGNGIYPPAKACLERHGIRSGRHVARQITSADIAESDMIFVMDRYNLRNLERMFGRDVACADNVRMLMEITGSHREVADPWYTGDFETTYYDVVAGCEEIISYIETKTVV